LVKKISSLIILSTLILWSCATLQPPPPNLYIGNLPQNTVARLSLDERIILEDAWENLKTGNGNKARKIISKLSSENPLYFSALGYSFYILHDLQNAEDYFKASTREYPDISLGHIGLAQLYQETGRSDLAFTEYREILKQEPEHPWAKPKYGKIKQRKTKEALDNAKTLFAREEIEAAKTSYLKALYYSPKATEPHLALAKIYNAENKPKNALVHLKAAYSNKTKDKEILEVYGETLFLAAEPSKSLEMYENLLELDPKNQKATDRIEILKNRLGIFELPSQYNAIPLSDAVTKEQMAAILDIKFKSIIESPPGKPPIIIDISTSWASKYIVKISSLGILDVYPNHTFQPKKIINRAEMAETISRLTNILKKKGYRFIQQIPPEKIQISDISRDNFYYQPIIKLISYNFASLSPGRKFNPDRPVSGQEAIKLLDIILALIK